MCRKISLSATFRLPSESSRLISTTETLSKTQKLSSTMIYSLQRKILGHTNSVLVISFSHDGHYCATGGEDGRLRIFSGDFKNEVQQFTGASAITSVVWHDKYQHLMLVSNYNGDVHIIQLKRRWWLLSLFSPVCFSRFH